MAGFSLKINARDSIKFVKTDQALKARHRKRIIAWNNAVREYVLAVAYNVGQHQDTGMSYASLFSIAKKVDAQIPDLANKRDSVKGLTYKSGVRAPDAFKTWQVGLKLGEKAGTINYGYYKRPTLSFTFEIRVFQFLINEFGYGKGAAWSSLKDGQDALWKYLLKHNTSLIPRISDFTQSITSRVI